MVELGYAWHIDAGLPWKRGVSSVLKVRIHCRRQKTSESPATWIEKKSQNIPKYTWKKIEQVGVWKWGTPVYLFKRLKTAVFCSGGRFTRGYSGKCLFRIMPCSTCAKSRIEGACGLAVYGFQIRVSYSCCICASALKTTGSCTISPPVLRWGCSERSAPAIFQTFEKFGEFSASHWSHWSQYPLVLQGSQVNVAILFTTHVEGLAVNTQLMAEEMDLWTQWCRDPTETPRSQISTHCDWVLSQ